MRAHLTGPLLTRAGVSKPREGTGLGARLQRQVQQFKNVRINRVDRESLQSKARNATVRGPSACPTSKSAFEAKGRYNERKGKGEKIGRNKRD